LDPVFNIPRDDLEIIQEIKKEKEKKEKNENKKKLKETNINDYKI
jgi:hypothetical protein